MKILTIGYFPENVSLPEGTEDNAEDIEFLEKILKKSSLVGYKGMSWCRCCQKANGSKEYNYQIKDLKGKIWLFKIPEGYLHYLKIHRLTPDPNLEILKKIEKSAEIP